MAACTTTPPPDPSASYRERLWAEVGTLPKTIEELLQSVETPGDELRRYLRTYNFEPSYPVEKTQEITRRWNIRLGLLRDQGTAGKVLPPLGVLVGVPDPVVGGNPQRGTVFLVHGYLDHSGSWSPVIKRILQEGFIVIALDLPGHGFSGGVRGDIEDFSRYGEAVRKVVGWALEGSIPRPWIAVGHSTGAAAIWMELVRQAKEKQRNTQTIPWPGTGAAGGTSTFDLVLFLAPLVRSSHWRLSMTVAGIVGWAIPYVKSRTVEDPLFPIPYFPLHWAEKLKEWERTVGEYPVLPQRGWILQGTADDVVDHAYSIPFLCSKLPNFQVRYIEGAGHVPYVQAEAERRFIRELIELIDQRIMADRAQS